MVAGRQAGRPPSFLYSSPYSYPFGPVRSGVSYFAPSSDFKQRQFYCLGSELQGGCWLW